MHISKDIYVNIAYFKKLFEGCADIKHRTLHLGVDGQVICFVAYVEITIENMILEKSVFGKLLNEFCGMTRDQVMERLEMDGFGIADFGEFDTMEDAIAAMMAGNVLMIVDGYGKAMKIGDKGYPNMGVREAESEKVIRGSNEGFTESVKVNVTLIRKRLKTPSLKVKESFVGKKSMTGVSLLYIKDLAPKEILQNIERRLQSFEIDGITDSGMLEQLTEEDTMSIFPRFQTKQRPDRAVQCLLEGRVIMLVDNSPVALILPTTYNSFIRTSDDYYNRWEIVSFTRLLRYLASFLAMALPGLYLAVTIFHTQVLPTDLLLSFAAARQGVPFPAVVELLIMEAAFELLREAGVRLPGPMSNTIGIVGGLIIGQAAVEANIVSTITVIIVALTALSSFAVPNEEFAAAFRILKFGFILVCAWFGLYGFFMGLFFVLIHLSRLQSFGIPFLTPFTGPEINQYQDEKDAFIRFPLKTLKYRPVFAKNGRRIKLRYKGK